MRRGYQTRRQFERSLHREPYLAQSAARGRDQAREREPDRVCGTCARFFPTPELVPGGVCGSTGEIVASVWSRPCWQAKTVPTDHPTNPAAVLRALVTQQPVEQTPDGLVVADVPTPDPADAPCHNCPGGSPDCLRGAGCCDPRNQEAKD